MTTGKLFGIVFTVAVLIVVATTYAFYEERKSCLESGLSEQQCRLLSSPDVPLATRDVFRQCFEEGNTVSECYKEYGNPYVD